VERVKAAYELTVLFLRLWLLGAIVLAVFSLSDFVFRRPHAPPLLVRRLVMSVIWPLALASSQGRAVLRGRLKGV
jgi:hypothetical protein